MEKSLDNVQKMANDLGDLPKFSFLSTVGTVSYCVSVIIKTIMHIGMIVGFFALVKMTYSVSRGVLKFNVEKMIAHIEWALLFLPCQILIVLILLLAVRKVYVRLQAPELRDDL
ncbi:MAG: hypothetical protein GKR87_12895 [Kiritimatiellae bacterium]|nr:hypothetical protein [Kiritimatiellia bacterium]